MKCPTLLRRQAAAAGALLMLTCAAAQPTGQTVAFVAEHEGRPYAMTRDVGPGGIAQAQAVSLSPEGEVVVLDGEASLYAVCWQVEGSASNARFHPYAADAAGTYAPDTGVGLLNQDNKLRLNAGTSDKPWKWNAEAGTWLYQYTSREKYGILLYPGQTYFKLNSSVYDGDTYHLTRPVAVAPHVFRRPAAAAFATLCLPQAVRPGELQGAEVYSVAGQVVGADGSFLGLALAAESGDLRAGVPYIYRLSEGSSALAAALHGPSASGREAGGLVGCPDAATSVPAGCLLLRADALQAQACGLPPYTVPAGCAYVRPADISLRLTAAEAAEAGYVVAGAELVTAVHDLPAPSAPETSTRPHAADGAAAFDLAGRRLGHAAPRGIVVRAGKKSAVR